MRQSYGDRVTAHSASARAEAVGFIGLGMQGAPIARRIADGGHSLRVWARSAATLASFGDVAVEPTPAALGRSCSIVCLCVTGDDDVLEVALTAGLLDAMRPGSVLVIHSTVSPTLVETLEGEARARGISLLDAPVSGGAARAETGSMTVFVGGDTGALERVRAVLASFATSIHHVGAIGTGQAMKLVNNGLCYANAVLAADALDMANALGIDRSIAAAAIRDGSGASFALEMVADAGRMRTIGERGEVLDKDAHLLSVLGERRGLDERSILSLARDARARFRAG